MQERGRMQEGMVADVTIFNPVRVTDNATYSKGTLPTTGIPHVIVNGQIVVSNEKVLPDVYPGQPIRFPVENEPRFEQLDVKHWREQYLEAPSGFHGLDISQNEDGQNKYADKRDVAKLKGDWFARRGHLVSLSAELHNVFCPIHRVYEQPEN